MQVLRHARSSYRLQLDDLNRLAKSQWEGSATSSQKRETIWTLTQAGNWDRVQRDLNDDDDFTDTGEMDDDRDPACPPACPADINGDCDVGIADFLCLLGHSG